MKFFDAKAFNAEAFGKYMESVPDVKRNKLLQSGAIVGDDRLVNLFANQTGSYYGTVPYFGNLEQTDPDNFDGVSNLTADTTVSYTQGVFVKGRAKGWTEKDFSREISSGVDFMANIRSKIQKYWYNVDQDELLAILGALFSHTGTQEKIFVDTHTYDISADAVGKMDATTLNTATQKACGDNKDVFTMVFMHSAVATNLENLRLVEHLKYTDANGVTRDLGMATWNGRLVVIDDSMPTEEVTADGGNYTKYTTYVLGNGVITWQPLSVTHPYEMVRDAKTNGGIETLYTRNRTAIAVDGFSWVNKSVATLSPTKAEMANPANWELIHDGNTTASKRKYYDHKAIAISRIVSKG